MDRRTFLGSAGSIGAVSAGGWAAAQSGAAAKRANGLAQAAASAAPAADMSASSTKVTRAPTVNGVVFGSLVGSDKMLAKGAPDYAANAKRLKWAVWAPANAASAGVAAALGIVSRKSVIIGGLRNAQSTVAPALVQSIDVTAFFAVDGGVFAPFYAWSYRASATGKPLAKSAPMVFDALAPDHMALQIDFTLDTKSISSTVMPTGRIYLPMGSSNGPGTGIYVVAAPSRTTGMAPVLTNYVFSGDPFAPLVDARGHAPDFDHLTISIQPA